MGLDTGINYIAKQQKDHPDITPHIYNWVSTTIKPTAKACGNFFQYNI